MSEQFPVIVVPENAYELSEPEAMGTKPKILELNQSRLLKLRENLR